ncbi:MAG: hypothetical protein IPJ19_00550 [Planctomycetes bacterium]|nr:hypothetical protein [Planctomycetota bacterium]
MSAPRTSTPDPAQERAARRMRLEALPTRALAARCLSGLAQLSEVILGPRARHDELVLEALLSRARAGTLDALQSELLGTRRELAERCSTITALERAQVAGAERERELQHELEDLRSSHAQAQERAESSAEERDALELGRRALDEIERELATLREERDWRAAEMQAAAAALEGLRFRFVAPALQTRARAWKAGRP